MNIIIFAGGAGTRLWPLSRQSMPKQFIPLKDGKSTLQMAVERAASFGYDHIFISTNEAYRGVAENQLPELPKENIFGEPARRDLAAAVCLTLVRLKQKGITGSIAMLWADHFVERSDVFVDALRRGEETLQENPNRFVFLGERPRFANQNLGWIHVGSEKEEGYCNFIGWKYKPSLGDAEEMLASGEWLWNPGYFIFDIDFCLGLYEKHQPAMIEKVRAMAGNEEVILKEYGALDSLSFDSAILEHLSPEEAVVLKVDMGWSDPGTLYALKEAMVSREEENYISGNVTALDTQDSFVYNTEPKKLVAAIGLSGMCVVNTKDAVLVCHKDDVPRMKELLEKIKEEGKEGYL